MSYTPNTKKAMRLCYAAHHGQFDKSGVPYVFHPYHVAEQMDSENTVIAALLHDVVEDTETTLDDLKRMGFDKEVIAAISLLTHQDGVPYLDYVAEIAKNPIARAVKLADLRHNMDLTRLEQVDDKARERIEKYKQAVSLLE